MAEGREHVEPEGVPAAPPVPPWNLEDIAEIIRFLPAGKDWDAIDQVATAAYFVALITKLAKKPADLKVKVRDAVTVREDISISDPLQARWVASHLPVEEIGKIRALAGAVFEDQAVGEAWLNEPNLATYNKAPIELLGTPGGFESIKNLLMRIEHGILA
jgi:Protein of unknown function (DUF2384)